MRRRGFGECTETKTEHTVLHRPPMEENTVDENGETPTERKGRLDPMFAPLWRTVDNCEELRIREHTHPPPTNGTSRVLLGRI